MPRCHLPFLVLVLAIAAAAVHADRAGGSEATAVPVVWTGDTRGMIEVCGCREGQFGGLPRRASRIENLQKERGATLLLDVGGIFDGDTPFDRERALTNLHALAAMGYAAVNVGASELRWGLDPLGRMATEAGVPLVSTNLRAANAPWQEHRIITRNGIRIAVLGVADPAPVAAHGIAGLTVEAPATALRRALADTATAADARVVLAALPHEDARALAAEVEGIDLVLVASEGPRETRVGRTLVAASAPLGKALLLTNLSRGSGADAVQHFFLGELVKEDPRIRSLLTAFYRRVEADPVLQAAGGGHGGEHVLFPEAIELDNRYTGSEACRECHEDIHARWRGTGHARAFDSLLRKNAHFLPSCVPCHAVGVGAPTGFRIDQTREGLRGVGCESCHGPGGRHTMNPDAGSIVREVPAERCRVCHDDEMTPDFPEREVSMRGLVDHSRARPTDQEDAALAYIREALAGRPDVVTVDLFTMSLCPHGTRAATAIAKAKTMLGDRMDLRVHFMARAREFKDEDRLPPARSLQRADACTEVQDYRADTRFTSLHGQAEVDEDIRQVVCQDRFGDRYPQYIIERNRDPHADDWRTPARTAGIDPEEVERIVAREGEDLLAANIRTAWDLSIWTSPTIFIDGRPYQGTIDPILVGRGVCERDPENPACDTFPACETNDHCVQAGKVGICEEPGTPRARCRFFDPVAVTARIITALGCDRCATRDVIRELRRFLPGLKVRTILHDTPEGQALIRRFDLSRLPAVVLDGRVEEAARYDRIASLLLRKEDAFLVQTPGQDGPYVIGAPHARIVPPLLALGTVVPGSPASGTIVVSNAGTGTIAVDALRALHPRLSAEAIRRSPDDAPGGVVEIRLTLDTQALAGPFEAAVFAHTNDPASPFLPIAVTADGPPAPEGWIDPLGDLPPDETGPFTLPAPPALAPKRERMRGTIALFLAGDPKPYRGVVERMERLLARLVALERLDPQRGYLPVFIRDAPSYRILIEFERAHGVAVHAPLELFYYGTYVPGTARITRFIDDTLAALPEPMAATPPRDTPPSPPPATTSGTFPTGPPPPDASASGDLPPWALALLYGGALVAGIVVASRMGRKRR